MKKINKNSFPFLILLVIHLSLLIYTIKKKGLKPTLRSLLPNIGLAYLFEYFVLNLFHAYTYYPKLMKNKYLDNLTGAILSQAVFVPIVATFLTLFKLGWTYRLFFTFYFFIVEQTFIKLKIYKHRWWRTKYTTLLLPVYFYISDYWISGIHQQTPFIITLSRYFTFVVNQANYLFLLAKYKQIRFGYRSFSWTEHFKLAPIYALIVSVYYTYQSQGLVKSRLSLLLLFLNDFLFVKLGFLKLSSWSTTILPGHMMHLFLVYWIRKLFEKKEKR